MNSNMVDIHKICEGGTCFDDRFINDYETLKETISLLKSPGKKIVLTQGVFDLIHEGHALYLEKAKLPIAQLTLQTRCAKNMKMFAVKLLLCHLRQPLQQLPESGL